MSWRRYRASGQTPRPSIEEETEGKSCVECHYNLVHRKVPDEQTFKRDAWNRMVEEEFGIPAGEADRILANE